MNMRDMIQSSLGQQFGMNWKLQLAKMEKMIFNVVYVRSHLIQKPKSKNVDITFMMHASSKLQKNLM